ncbi:hypothetical protein [Pandoraea sp. PE-S2T-3]|nr:hypothetical protein [Pandoraea sp. PE-S2T-3]
MTLQHGWPFWAALLPPIFNASHAANKKAGNPIAGFFIYLATRRKPGD